MKNVNFPTLAFKSSKNYIFAAGGGGDKDYGKENGIMAFRMSDVLKDGDDYEDVFKSVEIIHEPNVRSPNVEEQNHVIDKLVIKERPAIAEMLDTLDGEDTIEEVFESDTNEKVSAEGDIIDMKEMDKNNVEGDSIEKENNVGSDSNRNENNVESNSTENENVNESDSIENENGKGNDEIEDVKESNANKNTKEFNSIECAIYIAAIDVRIFYSFKFDGNFNY